MLVIRSLSQYALVFTLAIAATACGGGAEEPQAPNAKASLQLSALDELKAIPKDLETEVSNLTKPIDDVQSIIDDVTNLPKKHGITAADAMGMAKATVSSGKVEVKTSGELSAEAKAEIEALLTRLNGVVTGLKATPEKVAALTTKLAATTAKVPVLATKVSASAQTTIANPFGNAEGKAKAQADLASVQQVQADVTKSVSDTQSKIAGIPAMATSALAKLTAAFAVGS